MTQYGTDFSEYPTGSGLPADWTAIASDDTPWAVETDSSFSPPEHLSFSATTDGLGTGAWDEVSSSVADGEILVKSTLNNTESSQQWALCTRVADIGTGNDDLVEATCYNGDLAIIEYDNGSGSLLGTTDVGLTNGTTYWIRFRANSDTYQLRIWEDGNSEPGTWDLSETSSALTSGDIGVGGHGNNTADVDYAFVGVGTAADTAPSTVTEGYLETTISSYSYPGSDPIEGDTISVDVFCDNTGDAESSQTLELVVDGTVEDQTGVTLAAGNSTTHTLDWNSQDGDAGTATIETQLSDPIRGTEDSDQFTLLDAAFLDLTITDVSPSAPVEGETVTVSFDAQNTGDVSIDETIELDVDSTNVDTTDVSVASGATVSDTCVWNTSIGDGGSTYTLSIEPSDTNNGDTETTDVTVSEKIPVTVSPLVTTAQSPERVPTITSQNYRTVSPLLTAAHGVSPTPFTVGRIPRSVSPSITRAESVKSYVVVYDGDEFTGYGAGTWGSDAYGVSAINVSKAPLVSSASGAGLTVTVGSQQFSSVSPLVTAANTSTPIGPITSQKISVISPALSGGVGSSLPVSTTTILNSFNTIPLGVTDGNTLSPSTTFGSSRTFAIPLTHGAGGVPPPGLLSVNTVVTSPAVTAGDGVAAPVSMAARVPWTVNPPVGASEGRTLPVPVVHGVQQPTHSPAAAAGAGPAVAPFVVGRIPNSIPVETGRSITSAPAAVAFIRNYARPYTLPIKVTMAVESNPAPVRFHLRGIARVPVRFSPEAFEMPGRLAVESNTAEADGALMAEAVEVTMRD